MKAPQPKIIKEFKKLGYTNHEIMSFLLGEISIEGKRVVKPKRKKNIKKMKNEDYTIEDDRKAFEEVYNKTLDVEEYNQLNAYLDDIHCYRVSVEAGEPLQEEERNDIKDICFELEELCSRLRSLKSYLFLIAYEQKNRNEK